MPFAPGSRPRSHERPGAGRPPGARRTPAERPHPRRRRGLGRVAGAAVAFALVALLAAVGVWLNTPLRGERGPAIAAWTDPAITITADDGRFVLAPTDGAAAAGLVFFPGAKVDPSAYLATFSGVAAGGVTVVVADAPVGIAFLDGRSVAELTSGLDGVERWAVGGHSLGGVHACGLAPESAGLVLFGSYCANDLTESGVPVLSVAAEHDGLTTADDIASAAPLLPADAEFATIAGANHASFGAYGTQAGDGTASIGVDAMRDELVRLVVPFVTAASASA